MALGAPRCRTYKFKIHPTYRQTEALERQLGCQRELYNAALEERILAWKRGKYSITYIDQCRTLTGLVDVRPDVVSAGVTICRGTLKRLDRAFADFYRRVRAGETPGFPRFKSSKRFVSLQWEDTQSWKLQFSVSRLRLQGIGDVRVNFHRAVVGTPKAITVKKEGKKWWLSVRCVEVPASPLSPTSREVGIDLGVVNIVATSDGELIKCDRFGSQARIQLALAQKALARKQKGSKRRERQVEVVAQMHRKVANQRMNSAHQLSRRLVNEFDLIALENLSAAKMVRIPRAKPDPERSESFLPNGARAKAGLNRSINDAGWGILVSLLSYKAESAGRTVVTVDSRYTSQRCAECGHTEASNRVTQASFKCQRCGHRDHADSNAARNILRAGRARHAKACKG